MDSIQGYYDDVNIKPIGKFNAKPNQKVLITILEEFMESTKPPCKNVLKGIFSEYANQDLVEKEKLVWEHAMVEKHGNV
ncbi:MAG: hypothetical protein IJU79_00695 [Desulfovibrionaceae bacterium]|nr:hypothetical protein [Desulfovibrionaceae bacterium]